MQHVQFLNLKLLNLPDDLYPDFDLYLLAELLDRLPEDMLTSASLKAAEITVRVIVLVRIMIIWLASLIL